MPVPAEKAAESHKQTLSAIVAKLSSQILLFSLAIALVIVSAFAVAGQEALWPISAVLLVFLVGAFLYVFAEKRKAIDPSAPVTAPAAEARVMTAVPDKQESELAVEVWIKPIAGATADALVHKPVFRVGDRVRVCVRAKADCFLTLLNLSSDGALTMLFPNQHHRNNRIQKEKTYEIPSDEYDFDIILEEPAGLDVVKAIVTFDSRPLLEADFDHSGEFFHCIERSATPRAMRAVAREVERRDSAQWAAASTSFVVEPR